MHICVVTTAHPIDDVRVYQKFSCSFLEQGFAVTWVGPEWRQGGQGFSGDERISYKLFGRVQGKLGRFRAGLQAAALARSVEGVDWFYAPDPDSARIVAKLAAGQKAKAVFDIHENYHETPIDRWLGPFACGWVRKIARNYIAQLAARCDAVFAVNQAILESYAENHPRREVVRNCAPVWFADNFSRRNPGSTFRIMHGKAEPGRGTLQVLEALKLLRNKELALKVVMIAPSSGAVGGEASEIAGLLKSESEKVECQKPVGMREMPWLLSTCEAGLISYQRNLGLDSLPNRLFEYMAAGIAVVAPNYSPEIAKILDAERCGILVNFEEPADIATALQALAADPVTCGEMGSRGREAFMSRHNWESEFAKVVSIIGGTSTVVLKEPLDA